MNDNECRSRTEELRLLLENRYLIRNRKKIFSVRTNARAVKNIQDKFGSFDSYIWDFTDGQQVIGSWHSLDELPVESELLRKISKDMKSNGIIFAGPVITYSFLQSIGILNDHLRTCKYK